MSARSVGTAAAHWIGLVGLGRRLMRHCGAVVRLFLAGAVLAVATFIAPGLASATPPANSERPTLSGDPYVGSTLYATAGRWSGVPAPTYSYRWQYQASDGGWPDIAGATGPTYEIQPADLGTVIRVNVTATNSDGSAEQISEATAQIKNLPVTPPGPPDGLTAAVAPAPGVGSRQVELSWSPVASNGGLRVGDYVIQRSTDGRTWTTVADGVSANAAPSCPNSSTAPPTGSAWPPSTQPARDHGAPRSEPHRDGSRPQPAGPRPPSPPFPAWARDRSGSHGGRRRPTVEHGSPTT